MSPLVEPSARCNTGVVALEGDEDILKTLRTISYRLEHLETVAESQQDIIDSAEQSESEAEVSSFEKRIGFFQKWGWVLAAVSTVFSAGVAYAVFMGANATDDEVDTEVHQAIVKHNGFVDPSSIDAQTHRPIGEHPDLREAIKQNTSVTVELSKATSELARTQGKLDTRSRYQYEYTKWEVKKAECRQARNCTRRDLEKPSELEKLEAELIND